MNEKEKAAICLHCTEFECVGEERCYRERLKKYRRDWQKSRRRGQRVLDREYNKARAEEHRERRNAAITKHREEISNGKS